MKRSRSQYENLQPPAKYPGQHAQFTSSSYLQRKASEYSGKKAGYAQFPVEEVQEDDTIMGRERKNKLRLPHLIGEVRPTERHVLFRPATVEDTFDYSVFKPPNYYLDRTRRIVTDNMLVSDNALINMFKKYKRRDPEVEEADINDTLSRLEDLENRKQEYLQNINMQEDVSYPNHEAIERAREDYEELRNMEDRMQFLSTLLEDEYVLDPPGD